MSSHITAQRQLRTISGRAQVLLLGRAATGIWATLRALGIHQRHVLIPANSCYVVLWAVLHSGNIPLLVDVDPLTGNISREMLLRTGVDDAAAMLPCHMYGLPAPMEAITSWARERNIVVIEDAALALGGQVAGRPAGAWGDVAVFSFGLGKIVDNQVGGALATDDEHLAAEIERVLAALPSWDDALLELTNQWNNLYWALHQHEDQNARLLTLYPQLFDIYRPLIAYQLPSLEWNELPAELRRLDQNLAHRSAMADLYDKRLRGLSLRTFHCSEGSYYWRYPLFVAPEQRNRLLAHLWSEGLYETTRWYPSLCYMASALMPDIVQPPTPNADLLSASVINLPLDENTDAEIVDRTANIIGEYFDNVD